jgi:hypothetical protein
VCSARSGAASKVAASRGTSTSWAERRWLLPTTHDAGPAMSTGYSSPSCSWAATDHDPGRPSSARTARVPGGRRWAAGLRRADPRSTSDGRRAVEAAVEALRPTVTTTCAPGGRRNRAFNATAVALVASGSSRLRDAGSILSPWGCSSAWQSASFATKKSSVQIRSPPPLRSHQNRQIPRSPVIAVPSRVYRAHMKPTRNRRAG